MSVSPVVTTKCLSSIVKEFEHQKNIESVNNVNMISNSSTKPSKKYHPHYLVWHAMVKK